MRKSSLSLRPVLACVLSVALWAAVVGARQTPVAPAPAAQPAVPAGQADGLSPQSAEFFEARVRPLLVTHCYECHTDQKKGDLRVDSREALLEGGELGPAIVPGDPDESLLIQAVRHVPGAPKMPRGQPSSSPLTSTSSSSGSRPARRGLPAPPSLPLRRPGHARWW